MGKALYMSSSKKKEQFWDKIFNRRNQIINNKNEYTKTLIEDISNLSGDDYVDYKAILGSTG